MAYLFPPQPPVCLTIAGGSTLFPVRRIFCIGRNYEEHAREMGVAADRSMPFFFQKSPEAVVAQQTPDQVLEIDYPPATADLHHEVELVIALDQGGRDLSADQARGHIFGYAVGLDLTRRDMQAIFKDKRWPWDMAKNFDAAAPIGLLHPRTETGLLDRGAISLDSGGARRQTGDLGQMIWQPHEIVAELSKLVRLLPGDVIFTGTPAGVGAIQRGDIVDMSIEKLDSLRVILR